MPMEKKVFDVRVIVEFATLVRVQATEQEEAEDRALEQVKAKHNLPGADDAFVNQTTVVMEKGDE